MEETRAKFWTNIDADINKSKSCELDSKRDAKESQREQELLDTNMEERINPLLGRWTYLRQMLMMEERYRVEARDMDKSLVRKIDKAKGVVRETTE